MSRTVRAFKFPGRVASLAPDFRKVISVTFNGAAVTLDDVLTRLKLSGELTTALDEACRQLAIRQAARSHGLKPTAAEARKCLHELFREMGASNEEQAAATLAKVGLKLSHLHRYAEMDAVVEKLKQKLFKDRVAAYFDAHWEDYERVEFSEIAVGALSLAREIQSRLERGEATFEQLAQQHSLAPESRTRRGFAGSHARSKLPANVRDSMFAGNGGGVLGPLKVGPHYYLVRVERVHHASLDAQTREAIATTLFEQWLETQVARSDVTMPVLGA